MKASRILLGASLGLAMLAVSAATRENQITIQTDRPGVKISPTLYGLFFEEINHAGDGGLYAELIRNRSFEDAEKPVHWAILDGASRTEIAIDESRPQNAYNRRSLRWTISGLGNAQSSIANEGFWGISVKPGEDYNLSLEARVSEGFRGNMVAGLLSPSGKWLAQKTITGLKTDWGRVQVTFRTAQAEPKARLILACSSACTIWLDMVSLFPGDTWKGQPGGLRSDLAKMMEELRPSFVRFPGGCWVEGQDLKDAYRWKETIGPVSERRNQWNLWQYYSTHGLGYLEYLMLCENLGAEPLFVINCGMSHSEVVPMAQMGPFVQDALDAIEYANGSADTVWGSMRVRHGHPAPFRLKYLEIGNENGGTAYEERYALLRKTIKARYPDIHLIANDWGGIPKESPVELVDEHYYSTPEFFMANARKYDTYNRKGPKVYVGEYAVTSGCGQGNLRAAVGEAAFMTGMERNSDVVIMASYAPLFANVNYKKWNPDLINFDSSRAYGTPSYHVQQMFSRNRGDFVLPTTVEVSSNIPVPQLSGRIGLGTWGTQAEFRNVEVITNGVSVFKDEFAKGAPDWHASSGKWEVKEGVYCQTSLAENVQCVAGDPLWTDCTITLQARKMAGAEGFLILFHVRDANNWLWWNLGGWGNQKHAIEKGEIGGKSVVSDSVPGKIETNRWYDIKIVTKGQTVQCYLDDKLVHDFTHPTPQPIYATASLVKSSRELILKMVNASAIPQPTRIRLKGASGVKGTPQLWTLTSENGTDENSLENPTKVSPKTTGLIWTGRDLMQELPPNSVSVLRATLK